MLIKIPDLSKKKAYICQFSLMQLEGIYKKEKGTLTSPFFTKSKNYFKKTTHCLFYRKYKALAIKILKLNTSGLYVIQSFKIKTYITLYTSMLFKMFYEHLKKIPLLY